jgi:hypothetical protein
MEKKRDIAAAPHAGAFSPAVCRPRCRTSTIHHTSGTFDGAAGEGLGSRRVAGPNRAVNTAHPLSGSGDSIQLLDHFGIMEIQ